VVIKRGPKKPKAEQKNKGERLVLERESEGGERER
jgi:hypothetical protein